MVSRKTNRRAVVRNKWKRRIREAFRILAPKIKKDRAVVIQSRKIEGVPAYAALAEEIESLLAETKSLK